MEYSRAGALGLPDIGQLFPDNDPEWSGADSSIFMEEVCRKMESRGFRVGNVDVTLILQKPKVMHFCCCLYVFLPFVWSHGSRAKSCTEEGERTSLYSYSDVTDCKNLVS